MSAAARSGALLPLLPQPRHARRLAGSFRLSPEVPIVLAEGSDASDFASAGVLRDALAEKCGFRLPIETHARAADLGPRVELSREGEVGDAYRIVVREEAVRASAAGPAGLRYAVETLRQLAPRGARIAGCEIEDAPDFPHRGLMLDVSRGKVPTLDTLRGLVDLCVRLKLNVLMLYTEHTFRFRRHPEIGADASPLDAAQMRELDGYAAERHVELVPTLQSLGHMQHVLALPRYAHLAETERRWTIAPAEPGTYELLRDLYDEYLPNFRSRRFNANCDEPWDLALGKSAERALEVGKAGVFLDHVRRVRDLAASHGKRTMIWGDVVHAHPERIPEIDRDLVLLDWWYEAAHDYDRVRAFAANGIEFWVCPGTSSWNCLFPRVGNSLENIARYAEAGKRHGARGLVVTDWGDFGHYNLQGFSWFGFAFAAQQAWSGNAPAKLFDRAFSRVLFDDESGETARLYRELGALHDAGFPLFNASPLQALYFDDLGPMYFSARAKALALRRTLSGLVRAKARVAGAKHRFKREARTYEELLLAADTSLLAAHKGLAALELLAWRRRPASLPPARRRALAARLERLSMEQAALGHRLRRLWLERSAPSNFEITRRRLQTSIASLRRQARSLRRGKPSAPPPAPAPSP
ncbi:MAG TPA: glycoside hydrolase family 20 zincin-like fold domain-containing protein [Myxococcota bacterium]|nr:glycoside hydrolase family 20 zincin-like fold domain-containing protein [Myxococcota bacterium]